MSKHEIRLRRQRMTGRGSDRFRNYGAVLERHERDMRLKKVIKAFLFFLAAAFLVMLIVYIGRIQRKLQKTEKAHVEQVHKHPPAG